MTDEEKAIANGTSVQVKAKTTRKKTDRSQNDDVVMLTGEELKAQTSKNIGELSKASSNSMLQATNRTTTQMLALGVIQSMPQNIADATDLVTDFFDSYDCENLALTLTMDSLPTQTQALMLTGI